MYQLFQNNHIFRAYKYNGINKYYSANGTYLIQYNGISSGDVNLESATGKQQFLINWLR